MSVSSARCANVSSESRPCGRRDLAVWPLGSGRVASGLSPRGVASFVHARSGAPDDQGRTVCNLPGPCPPTCSRPPVVPHVPSPRGVAIAFLAGFHGALSPLVASGYEPRRQAAQVRRAVLDSACRDRGLSAGPEAVPGLTPITTRVPERGTPKAPLVIMTQEGRPHQVWKSGGRGQYEDK